MYCSLAEVRTVGIHMSASAEPKFTDELGLALIERVSRLFDLEVGCDPGYFDPALYPVWQSAHTYAVGDIITPTTPNAHKYRCTTAGISGNTEPSWTTVANATFTDGAAVFTENGADVIATTRTFYGDGTTHLKLDPYVPGTLNTTLSLPTGYTAPSFTERDGYLVLTSTDGVLTDLNSRWAWTQGWWKGVPITITAKWGYTTTPADVKLAVIEWIINVWRETDPVSQRLVNLDGMALREQIPPRVAGVAKDYRVKTARALFV